MLFLKTDVIVEDIVIPLPGTGARFAGFGRASFLEGREVVSRYTRAFFARTHSEAYDLAQEELRAWEKEKRAEDLIMGPNR